MYGWDRHLVHGKHLKYPCPIPGSKNNSNWVISYSILSVIEPSVSSEVKKFYRSPTLLI